MMVITITSLCWMEATDIPLALIRVSPSNTRKDMEAGTEDTGLLDLIESIRVHGLINPVIVQERDGGYEVVAGQRRLQACRELGMTTIPAVIRNDLDPTDATVLSLVENIHRADMNPIDKANAYKAIYDRCGDYRQTAKQCAVSVPTVRRYMSLLNLAPSIQHRVSTADGPAGIGTLEQVAKRFSPEDQETVLDRIQGFNQRTQSEILKRSGGNPDTIEPLVGLALEGAFNRRDCQDGLCFVMPEDLKRSLKEKFAEEMKPGF